MHSPYKLFDSDLSSYLDEGFFPPPKVKHTDECLSIQPQIKRRKIYTLPISCIKYGCSLSSSSFLYEKSHLKLHSGVSLQHTLQDFISRNLISTQDFYEIIECHKKALYETITEMGNLQFSRKRKSSIKIKGKIINYKKENDEWIYYIDSPKVIIDKISLSSDSIKINGIKGVN